MGEEKMPNVWVVMFIAYLKWGLFFLANYIFTCIRNISWILNGTYWRLLQNRHDENYEECAHVMKIIGKHRLDIFVESRISDYVLVHDRFVHPEYVFNDDITLLQITESHAIFVEGRPGAEPAYKFNFFILGQFASAEKIITMPLNQFHRLAETMEEDGGRVLFLQNQSRCGGTLFAHVFLETGRCIMFNEPHVINAFCKFHYMERIWGKEEATRIFNNTVRLLCKPYRGLGQLPLLYVVKPTTTCILGTDDFQEMMPEALQLFIYRDPKQVAISLRRLAEALQTLRLVYNIPAIPNALAPSLRFIGIINNDFQGWTAKYSYDLELGYRMAAVSMYHYLRCRKAGVPIDALKYEDLVKTPEQITRKMFHYCKLPENLVALGVEALKKDSQGQMLFSRDKLRKLIPNPPKVTPKFLEAAREMSESFGVPGPDNWEDFHLEGTLLAD